MQVNAISGNLANFGNQKDAIVSLDDKALKTIAYTQTSAKCNPEKARRINNAMFYSVPVVAGLAATILNRGKNVNIFGKALTGKAAALTHGVASFGLWAAGLLAADIVVGASRAVANKSEKVDKFDRKHPILSFLAVVGASVGLFALGSKGVSKLAKNQKVINKLGEWTEKAANKINKSKFLVKVADKFNNVVAKTPKKVKSIGKWALDWSPELLIGTTLAQSIGFAAAQSKAFQNNYQSLKDEQLKIAKERVVELNAQNDFLRQFEDNQDRLAHTPKPIGDMEV